MKKTALAVFLTALIYYLALCAKDWTWVFISGDSGDWLTAANWWIVPQPYGSPLWIVLCKLVGFLPGSQPLNLTILLSVLPGAITVTLVYLIVRNYTTNRVIPIVSAVALLGSTVFLTQATVLEQYVLATMLLTLSFYFRQQNRSRLAALVLGLSVAVHVLVLLIGLFWLIVDWKYWRQRLSGLIIAGGVVIVSHSFILVLMALDTPRLFAGGLSYASLITYLTSTGQAVIGQLSLFQLPQRLWDMSRVLLITLGLTAIPVGYAIKCSLTPMRFVLLGIIASTLGFYLLSIDYLAWTFVTFASPSFAILAGIGLAGLKPYHTHVVLVGCIGLIVLNSIFMNASVLTRQNPVAREYYTTLESLPPGTVVITYAGFYSMGAFYAISRDVPIIPLVATYLSESYEFDDYRKWLNRTYDLRINKTDSTLEAIQDLLVEGREVYIAYYADRIDKDPTKTSLLNTLTLEGTGDVRKVVGVRND